MPRAKPPWNAPNLKQPLRSQPELDLAALRLHSGDSLVSLIDQLTEKYPGLPALFEATQRRHRLLRALREVREPRATQDAVAKLIRTWQPQITRLERGDADPKLSTLERLAASLGLVFFWQLLDPEGTPAAAAYTWAADVAARAYEGQTAGLDTPVLSLATLRAHSGDALVSLIDELTEKYPRLPGLFEATQRRHRLLRALREVRARRATQDTVAKRISTQQPQITRLERGDADPRLSTLERFAAGLGLVFFWQVLDSQGTPAAAAYTWAADIAARMAGVEPRQHPTPAPATPQAAHSSIPELKREGHLVQEQTKEAGGRLVSPPQEMYRVSTRVNGTVHTDEVEPRVLLVDFIRTNLRLTGTHIGCDTSNCGACTVLLDGEPVKSCTLLAVQATDREITTVEGLAHANALSPVQIGFYEEHALQCGFCTPGMLLVGTALLEENSDPTDDEIRWAISGNICRCTGYMNIVKAIRYAAKLKREAARVGTRAGVSAPGGR
jgi:aerobic carbon-monoxide dehydrogenase small subunit